MVRCSPTVSIWWRGLAQLLLALGGVLVLPAAAEPVPTDPQGEQQPGETARFGPGDPRQQGVEYRRPKHGARFAFNLVDADLVELIKIISNITGKSFILGGKVPKIRATIYAPRKISAGEAYQAFLSILRINNLGVVPAGRYLKIVQATGVTSLNTPLVRGKPAPGRDQLVTKLLPCEHVDAERLRELLDRFKSPEGDIAVYAATNTLIITDYGAAIRRLEKLAREFDTRRDGMEIWIEPVNYADVDTLAEQILELFQEEVRSSTTKRIKSKKKKRRKKKGKKRRATRSSGPNLIGAEQQEVANVLPEQRTNSLIVIATETGYLRALSLIDKLDIEIAGDGTVHVHKLQHADANELAKTLNNLARGSRRSGKGKKGKRSSDGGELFEGELQITADKATNSLVIVSSLRDYLSLKSVIDILDSMQRQVFVEAVIMEVSLDKNRDLGLGFHAGNTIDGDRGTSLIYGSSQPNDQLSSLMLGPGALSGLAAGIRGPELEGTEDLLGAGISIPAFGVALQALQTNSDVNVLSTPHILATDNVEASITVGENIPVQQGMSGLSNLMSMAGRSGQTGGSGSTAALGALGAYGGFGGFGMGSIGRQNVGLTLKITPYINDDNQVRLEIDLEISEVKSIDPTTGPTISKQNAATTSVVTDQQTIVIGGLITDNQVETTQKVPVLGDIPILGFLFRHKSSLTRKRNLLIFLTPYIIRTPEDFREIFNRKMAERREFIERYTAFEFHRYDPHLDWSRTNGAIAVVNEVVTEAEQDRRLAAESRLRQDAGHAPKPPLDLGHRGSAADRSVGSAGP